MQLPCAGIAGVFPRFSPFLFFCLSLNKAKEDWGGGWGGTLLCEDQRESTTSRGALASDLRLGPQHLQLRARHEEGERLCRQVQTVIREGSGASCLCLSVVRGLF